MADFNTPQTRPLDAVTDRFPPRSASTPSTKSTKPARSAWPSGGLGAAGPVGTTASKHFFQPTLFWWMLCLTMPTFSAVAAAHEFEDGHVERSVAVVIRGDTGRIEYSIGLNPQTRQQLIQSWTGSSVAPTPATELESNITSADVPREVAAEDATAKQNGVAPANGVTPASDVAEDPFLKLAAANVTSRLRVTANGDRLPLELISSSASARHHVDVTVALEFKIPFQSSSPVTEPSSNGRRGPSVATDTAAAAAEPLVLLNIADRNFQKVQKTPLADGLQQLPKTGEPPSTPSTPLTPPSAAPAAPNPVPMGGGFRYACKATGATLLTRSNVASILIRAQRRFDDDLSDAQKLEAFKIEVELIKID